MPLVGGSGSVEYVETALEATLCSSMAVSRLMALGTADAEESIDARGLSGWDPALSPVKGGVGGTTLDDRWLLGFEYTLPDMRDAGARCDMRIMSNTPGARVVVPREELRSIDVREVFPGGEAKLPDHKGEKALGVSGNV